MRHKNTPKFIDRNLKTDYQVLIIFGINIPDTTGNQTTIYAPSHWTSVSAPPGENKIRKILHFYSMQYHYSI